MTPLLKKINKKPYDNFTTSYSAYPFSFLFFVFFRCAKRWFVLIHISQKDMLLHLGHLNGDFWFVDTSWMNSVLNWTIWWFLTKNSKNATRMFGKNNSARQNQLELKGEWGMKKSKTQGLCSIREKKFSIHWQNFFDAELLQKRNKFWFFWINVALN